VFENTINGAMLYFSIYFIKKKIKMSNYVTRSYSRLVWLFFS